MVAYHWPMDPRTRALTALWRCFEAGRAGRTALILCAMARRGVHSPLDLFYDHPLCDEWRDFAYCAVEDHLRKRKGIVYVVTNPMNPGFYKIGVTGFDVNKRLRSLKSAGVVGEFVEVETAVALDRYSAESRAHQAMQKNFPRHKEFFFTDYKTASKVMRQSVASDNAVLKHAFSGVCSTSFDLPECGNQGETSV